MGAAWLEQLATRLATTGPGYTYGLQQQPASEPTALAALALTAHGDEQSVAAANRALQWLAETQLPDGQVPVRRAKDQPGWTTALASIAWSESVAPHDFQRHLDRAAAWMLSTEGKVSPRQPQFGHDSTLVGWPWVVGTHTWLEPTILHVLALSARGWSTHARVVEGKRIVENRLLPAGGCNYGNTVVLGQTLLPHLQPSGMALLALADQPALSQRTKATVEYVRGSLGGRTAPASLSWAAMGLTAVRNISAVAHAAAEPMRRWLEQASQRSALSDHHVALLLLAGLQDRNPLVRIATGASP